MATKMLLAKTKEFPASPLWSFEKASTMSVEIGRETIKPPKTGFVLESHSTKDKINDVSTTLRATSNKIFPPV
jgi:hypothetical protein